MERAFVDSSVWIAYLSARDRLHGAAEDAIRDVIQRRVSLLTTNFVLAEVQRWLLFRGGLRLYWAALERIERSPSLVIVFATAEHHAAGRRWLTRFADQRISYADAVSFAVMDAAGCTLALTFDGDFTTAGFVRAP